MVALDTNTKLQIVLAGAKATNDCKVLVSFADVATGSATGAPQTSTTNGTTAVDIAAAPSAGNVRGIKSIQLYNADTASITLTIRTNNSGTLATLVKIVLAVGYNLQYESQAGWIVSDKNGNSTSVTSLPGRLIKKPVLLTSGTAYVIPPNCTAIDIEMIGGGGGGAGVHATNAVIPGGAGAAGRLRKYIANPQATVITYAIGAAGAGGSNAPQAGGDGGNTTFTCNSVTYTANGGKGAPLASDGTGVAVNIGGSGGTATNGDVNATGTNGTAGIGQDTTTVHSVSGLPGSTFWGGAAINRNTSAAGSVAAGFGCGGSSAIATAGGNAAGGAGSAGIIIIREYW